MLLTNRLFEREPPNREAKSIYIFCEGVKRELQYFRYFTEMDSRINIEVHQLDPHDNNSPLGLLRIARQCIIPQKGKPPPKYHYQQNDEVWIILDLDLDKYASRSPQIDEVKAFCTQQQGWHLALSNPCFEVWLHYHLSEKRQEFEGDERCSKWKEFVNSMINGGFDSRKHPIYIANASTNARTNFEVEKNIPRKDCTEIFRLGESMLTILGEKITKVLKELET